MAEYIVAIDVTRDRFPADAFSSQLSLLNVGMHGPQVADPTQMNQNTSGQGFSTGGSSRCIGTARLAIAPNDWMCMEFAICSECEVPNLQENGDRILPAWHPGGSVMEENHSIMVPQWHQDRQSRFFCLFSRGFLQPHSLGPSEASASSSPLTRAFQGRQSHGKSEYTSYPLRRQVRIHILLLVFVLLGGPPLPGGMLHSSKHRQDSLYLEALGVGYFLLKPVIKPFAHLTTFLLHAPPQRIQ